MNNFMNEFIIYESMHTLLNEFVISCGFRKTQFTL